MVVDTPSPHARRSTLRRGRQKRGTIRLREAPRTCLVSPTTEPAKLAGYRPTASPGTVAWSDCRTRKQRNRCFSDKAVAVWQQLADHGYVWLVEHFLREVEIFRNVRGLDRSQRKVFSDHSTPWSARARGRARSRPASASPRSLHSLRRDRLKLPASIC